MLAAGTGNVDTVDLLLQCGAKQSINTTDLVGVPRVNSFSVKIVSSQSSDLT